MSSRGYAAGVTAATHTPRSKVVIPRLQKGTRIRWRRTSTRRGDTSAVNHVDSAPLRRARSWGPVCFGCLGSGGGVLSTAQFFWRLAGPARKACGLHPSAGLASYGLLDHASPTGGVEDVMVPSPMHEHVSGLSSVLLNPCFRYVDSLLIRLTRLAVTLL